MNAVISAPCANEAIVSNKRNHINNKTGGKCHALVTSLFSKTKVSFVFRSTKDLQEIPLANRLMGLWEYGSMQTEYGALLGAPELCYQDRQIPPEVSV